MQTDSRYYGIVRWKCHQCDEKQSECRYSLHDGRFRKQQQQQQQQRFYSKTQPFHYRLFLCYFPTTEGSELLGHERSV